MIDTVTQSSGSALRYIRPLLDTAKVWRSCKNSCSSFVFSFFRLLLHSESSLFGLMRLRHKTDDAIRSASGNRPTLLRPPYGSITARQKKWINQEFGYKIVLWDVDPLDWRRPGSNVVCNRIIKMARAGSIILAHDIHPGTIEAMPCVLSQLEAKGFKFVTVSELIAMQTPLPPKPSPSPKSIPPKSTSPSPTPHN